MNEQTAMIESLRKDWQSLKSALHSCDEIHEAFFLDVFQKTAECLSGCVAEKAIAKEYIPLIADVYAFVDTEAGDSNVQIQAAKILSERMVYQYAVNPQVDAANPSCVTIYILKSKRQLTIDFSEVAIAFTILTEALQM